MKRQMLKTSAAFLMPPEKRMEERGAAPIQGVAAGFGCDRLFSVGRLY